MLSKVISIVLVTLLCVALMTEAVVDRKRRAVGWQPIAVTDPEVKAVAAEATTHIENAKNSAEVYRLQVVVSAMYQISKGKKFELTLRIGQTNCSRQGQAKNCLIVKIEQCAVSAFVSQGNTEIKDFSCENEKNPGSSGGGGRGGIKGGEIDVDVNRKDVQEAATFAAEQLTLRLSDNYVVELKRVTKATSQVVAGVKYRMTMEVEIKKKDEDDDSKDTSKIVESDTCNVKVWDQSLQTPRYTFEAFTCDGGRLLDL